MALPTMARKPTLQELIDEIQMQQQLRKGYPNLDNSKNTSGQGWSLGAGPNDDGPPQLFGANVSSSPTAPTPVPQIQAPFQGFGFMQRAMSGKVPESMEYPANAPAPNEPDPQGDTSPTDFSEMAMSRFGPTGSLAHAGRPDLSDTPGRYGVTRLQEPSKPVDEQTDGQKRSQRIERLNMMKSIAGGAGQIGDAFVEYGDRMAHRPIRKAADYTGGIDQAIADAEDEMPKNLVEQLKKAGYSIPEGTKFSQFKSIAPALSSAMSNQAATARAAHGQQAQQQRHEENLDLRSKNFQQSQALKEKLGSRVSDSKASKIAELDGMIQTADQILQMKPRRSTGPLDNAAATIRDMTPWANEESIMFDTLVNEQLAKKIKQFTGVASNSRDWALIQSIVPSLNTPDEKFKAKMEQVKLILERARNAEVGAIEAQGKSYGSSTQGSASSGMVHVRLPDGTEDDIHESRVEDAKLKHPGLQVIGK